MGEGGWGVAHHQKYTKKAVTNSRRNETDAYGMRRGHIGLVSHS